MIIKNYKKNLSYLILLIFIFLLDRVSKIYILNLAETKSIVDIYITSYLNFYLIWNTGIGFGLFSFVDSIYNLITTFIIILNIIIMLMIYRSNDYKVYFLILILGGSLGNVFDRLYYSAVPDFIDFHINNFHWFIFNVADIFISIGIICLVIDELIFNKERRNEKK